MPRKPPLRSVQSLEAATLKLHSILQNWDLPTLAIQDQVNAVRAGHAAPSDPVELVGALAECAFAALGESGVMEGLSSEQQQRLVLLFGELTTVADVDSSTTRRNKRWAKYGLGYMRVLTKKTEAARAALEIVVGLERCDQ